MIDDPVYIVQEHTNVYKRSTGTDVICRSSTAKIYTSETFQDAMKVLEVMVGSFSEVRYVKEANIWVDRSYNVIVKSEQDAYWD